MSPLAKQVIDALAKEEDNNLISQVLDFYGYLKEKKRRQEEIKWQLIKEDEATVDEDNIISKYQDSKKEEYISLVMLTRELGLNE